ncbi:hypothetical protein N9064_00685 [bacterium]|nr:hypothetical protein [bacterium]
MANGLEGFKLKESSGRAPAGATASTSADKATNSQMDYTSKYKAPPKYGAY